MFYFVDPIIETVTPLLKTKPRTVTFISSEGRKNTLDPTLA